MFNMLNIPLPPAPGGALGMLIGTLIMLAGVMLSTLGRVVVWRLVSAATLGAFGVPIGAWLAGRTGYSLFWLTAGTVSCMLGLGLLVARLYWAWLLAAIASATALLCVLHLAMQNAAGAPTGFESDGINFVQWTQLLWPTLGDYLRWMLAEAPIPTVIAGGGAGLIAAVSGMLKPLAMRILATSLIGAAMTVGGLCMAVSSIVEVNLLAGRRPWILMGVTAIATIIALAYQTRGHLRAKNAFAKVVEAAKDTSGESEPRPGE